MSVKKLLALLSCLSLLCLCACGVRAQSYSITYTDVFDTVTTVTAYAAGQSEFRRLADFLHAELLECHRLFDIYAEYDGMNNLCTVNRLAGGEAVAVDGRILRLLAEAQEMSGQSGQKLNICAGSVLSLWHDARVSALADPAAAALPDPEALLTAQAHIDPGALELDPEAGTVRLSDPEARLDVGAVAKGWAVQYACEQAKAAGYSGFLVSAGGNVCTVGRKPNGEGWRIALEDPLSGGELYCLTLADRSAVTSGVYQRYFTVDGKAYAHIIDPDTGYPAERYAAVTVVCADSAAADALSTALFLLPQADGLALLERYDAEALWLCPDGTGLLSPGFLALSDSGSAETFR